MRVRAAKCFALGVLDYGVYVKSPMLCHSPLARLTLLMAVSAVWAVAQTGGEAKVVSMAGQVSVLRDNSKWALNPGDIIQPQQMIVTGSDSYAVFRVADGSTFDVYPNAQVIFRSNRGNWRELLDILLGKVKVQIEHFGGQPNPNTIRTPTAVIAVRGTIFDVDVEDSDATTLVLVEEGRVDVRHLTQPGQVRQLNQGEWVRVFKNQPLAAKGYDRGAILQRVMRAASDALNEALYRTTRGGTGTAGTGGATASGDTGAKTPTTGNGSTSPTPPAATAPPAATPPH